MHDKHLYEAGNFYAIFTQELVLGEHYISFQSVSLDFIPEGTKILSLQK